MQKKHGKSHLDDPKFKNGLGEHAPKSPSFEPQRYCNFSSHVNTFKIWHYTAAEIRSCDTVIVLRTGI